MPYSRHLESRTRISFSSCHDPPCYYYFLFRFNIFSEADSNNNSIHTHGFHRIFFLRKRSHKQHIWQITCECVSTVKNFYEFVIPKMAVARPTNLRSCKSLLYQSLKNRAKMLVNLPLVSRGIVTAGLVTAGFTNPPAWTAAGYGTVGLSFGLSRTVESAMKQLFIFQFFLFYYNFLNLLFFLYC